MKIITIVITALIFLLIAVMTGCVEKQAPISNTEFRNIAGNAASNITQQYIAIVEANNRGDFVTTKTELATFDVSLTQYIREIKDMEVAENTVPCKKALISAFEACQVVGIYFDAHLENPTVDTYTQLGAQIDNMLNQMEISSMLAKTL